MIIPPCCKKNNPFINYQRKAEEKEEKIKKERNEHTLRIFALMSGGGNCSIAGGAQSGRRGRIVGYP